MISDVVCEHIVKKKIEAPDKLKMAAMICAYAIAVGLLVILMIALSGWMPVIFMCILGVIYLAFHYIQNFNYEYEYSFVNGELDVEKIVNMSKRKPIVELDIRNCTKAGVYDAETFDPRKYTKVFNCCGTLDPEDAIYLEFRHKDKDDACLIIERDDKMFKAMRPYFSASVYREAFGR
ncbi:MAG: hypothetical protein IJC18_04035 [Clostridia bacterium]|nr:hypothetical protein [Clostridia bacterium]MBQ9993308.1 hypothetical protein [Clostridia bacterium]